MSFKTTTKILIPCFIATIAVFGFLFLFSAKNYGKITENNFFPSTVLKKETSNETKFSSTSAVVSLVETEKYKNDKYGFSFNHPSDFTVREFPEDGGKTALIIQNEKTKQAIQIYITSYDDPDFAVSAEQIRRDLPDLPFSNSVDVIVGGKAKGVAFFSRNEAFSETAEAWFADGKNFYQVTAYRKDIKMLEDIIKSWKFKEIYAVYVDYGGQTSIS